MANRTARSAVPIRSAAKAPAHLLYGLEEERRRLLDANRDLRGAQRVQTEFLAKLSHDLRTPLTSLREFVSILRDGLAGSLTEVQRDYLGIALRNADILTEMIEHLLVLSRIQQGYLRITGSRIRLTDLLGDPDLLIGGRPKNKIIRLKVEIAPGTPDVYADPDRLLEAVRNLVDNAIKYSGSAVDIAILAAAEGDGMVALLVRDNGRGIDPATLRRLFSRFCRGAKANRDNPGGLGLGLSIVKEIVELQGGSVGVSSKLGVGTEFRLRLPRYEPKAILVATLRNAWRMSADGGPGFAHVRAGIKRWRGAVDPARPEAMRRTREVLARALRPEDFLLPDGGASREVRFLLTGERSSMHGAIRKLQRTVADRLGFRSAIEVEWIREPKWLHSRDFDGPDQMVEAILHQRCCTGELIDVA